MYRYEDIRKLHVEPTERCNAACPMCSRNHHGSGLNPSLRDHELSLEDFRAMLPTPFLSQLEELTFCGNFGDPIVANESLEMLQYVRSANPDIALHLHTNGGARAPEWWSRLGELFSSPRDRVAFGIDGLADTHHLYRRRTSWHRVIENARAFVASGGRAEWAFLIFRHNQHEVEECERLAREMGFVRFTVKATKRFLQTRRSRLDPTFPVLDEQGSVEYLLEPTTRSDYANPGLVNLSELEERHGGLDAYLDRTPIDCLVQQEANLYLSAAGYVLPCCWVASQLCPQDGKPELTEVFRLVEKSGGIDQIDARKRSVREILEGAFFQTVLPESWERPSLKAGKPRVCARICGRELKSFEGQFTKVDLETAG